MKKCPFCSEEIHDDAKKCKHCGEWLEGVMVDIKKKLTVKKLLAAQDVCGRNKIQKIFNLSLNFVIYE